MTSFKKYFLYHFRSTFLRLVIISFLAFLLVFIYVSVEITPGIYTPDLTQPNINIHSKIQRINFSVLNTLTAIISTIIPILELLPFKNKRNMDTMLFLPIDRRKLAAVHFINGFIHVFLINLVCFITAFFVLIMKSAIFDPWNLVQLFAVFLLGSFIVYAVTAFIFDRANLTADGIVWLVIYSFIGILMFTCGREIYETIVGKTGYYFTDYYFPEETDILDIGSMSPYSVLFALCNSIDYKLFYDIYYVKSEGSIEILNSYNGTIPLYELNAAILWSVIALLCTFAFIWFFNYKRPEKIGGISSSIFGYKLLLPLLSTVIILPTILDAKSVGLTIFVIMLVTMIVGYIVYRRSIRFKIWDYISIGLGLTLPLILRWLILNH